MRTTVAISSKCRRRVPADTGISILLASAIVPLLVIAVFGIVSLVP